MKKIAVSMRNRVFAESMMFMLERTGDFYPVRILSVSQEDILLECLVQRPEILLLDVTPTVPETTVEGRLKLIAKVREQQPDCKIAVFCDETAHPEQAYSTKRAKQDGRIDAFFYASVTAEYLSAALDAI
ncbi:MAG: hypothetical protein ACI4F3_08050 [Enterocloster sp.]